MAVCSTTMIVVPTGGKITVPLLGCGPTEWWPFGGVVIGAFALWVAVPIAVADEAGAAGPDEPLLVWGAPDPVAEVEPDDPPHAASSSTSDTTPVAAAHPLLRIPTLQFTEMSRS